jgi:hypothetical protein
MRVSPAQADKPANTPASDLLAPPAESPAAPDAAQKFIQEAHDLNNVRKSVSSAFFAPETTPHRLFAHSSMRISTLGLAVLPKTGADSDGEGFATGSAIT